MITFRALRTRRMDVQLQELSIGDEIGLCNLPELAHEKALTAFLEHAIQAANAPTPRHIANPRAWSVGERLFALAHYCVHVREDGPDYAVTTTSKLSDYLDAGKDIAPAPMTFTAAGDNWEVRPLTGAAVEALESLQGQVGVGGRAFWIIGAMAAQMARVGEETPDPVAAAAEYGEWLQRRFTTMRSLPASAFTVMFAHFSSATKDGGEFFRLWFDDQGVIVLPREAGAVAPAARFLVSAGISELAISLEGKA